MKCALAVMLALALVGPAAEALADEPFPHREPLEGKRKLAPIRGRRLGPARFHDDKDEVPAWKREEREREREDRDDRGGGRGGKGGDDADEE